jgi:hypothetical protein
VRASRTRCSGNVSVYEGARDRREGGELCKIETVLHEQKVNMQMRGRMIKQVPTQRFMVEKSKSYVLPLTEATKSRPRSAKLIFMLS